ncbi:hypothetical protein DM02DRAFT_676816 [Periconia macrospinosa]|uniref:Uncharacterized protein n=1 Tax=Periconia macrospinosa TaxID=97972 RepID=A0A2V1D7B5_9PLEO|nr:hypothetical protein DM02DRAFT_676816 [Periconia macrospinosa]
MQAIVGRDVDEGEEDWFEEDWFEETDSDDELDKEQEEKLEELVLTFVLHLLDHPLGDNEYSSALISAMAVLGINANSGWVQNMANRSRIDGPSGGMFRMSKFADEYQDQIPCISAAA